MTNSNNVSNDCVLSYLADVSANYANRYDFEVSKDKLKCAAKVKKHAELFTSKRIGERMMQANVSSNFMNYSQKDQTRMNEKTQPKIAALARLANQDVSLDAMLGDDSKSSNDYKYTRCILLSIDNFAKNGLVMKERETKSACSKDHKLQNSSRSKLVIRHKRVVDASTITAQFSSSNNALLAFNIIKEIKDDDGDVAFIVNHENPITALVLAEMRRA